MPTRQARRWLVIFPYVEKYGNIACASTVFGPWRGRNRRPIALGRAAPQGYEAPGAATHKPPAVPRLRARCRRAEQGMTLVENLVNRAACRSHLACLPWLSWPRMPSSPKSMAPRSSNPISTLRLPKSARSSRTSRRGSPHDAPAIRHRESVDGGRGGRRTSSRGVRSSRIGSTIIAAAPCVMPITTRPCARR